MSPLILFKKLLDWNNKIISTHYLSDSSKLDFQTVNPQALMKKLIMEKSDNEI